MAFFGATIETVEKVLQHPNADRLSIAKLKGLAFNVVIGLNQFKEGDKVLYIPIDALLPEPMITALNLTGRLSGKNKNRTKSIALRGVVSQGLVCPVDKFLNEEWASKSPEEIIKFLGIEKYEPPVRIENNANLIQLPEGQTPYDIEGADRYQNIVDLMLDKNVVVMEKMEGQNFSVSRIKDKIFVNQKNFSIEPKDGEKHSFWVVAEKFGLIDAIKSIPGDEVQIYAEFTGPGIQKNIYGLKGFTLFLFDLRVDRKWIGFDQFVNLLQLKSDDGIKYRNDSGALVAPVLYKGPLNQYLKGESVQEASNGKSLYGDTLREGIVIKPATEEIIENFGRLIIKQRSPQYLSGSDN